MIDLSSWTSLLHEYRAVVGWIAIVSGVVFVGSLIAVPWIVVRIPEDYFGSPRRPRTRFASEYPVLRWTIWTLRNVLGVILVLAGLVMLVLPGQGILTLAVGLLMMDFPGKHQIERRVIQSRLVIQPINWVRRKADVRPLQLDDAQ